MRRAVGGRLLALWARLAPAQRRDAPVPGSSENDPGILSGAFCAVATPVATRQQGAAPLIERSCLAEMAGRKRRCASPRAPANRDVTAVDPDAVRGKTIARAPRAGQPPQAVHRVARGAARPLDHTPRRTEREPPSAVRSCRPGGANWSDICSGPRARGRRAGRVIVGAQGGPGRVLFCAGGPPRPRLGLGHALAVDEGGPRDPIFLQGGWDGPPPPNDTDWPAGRPGTAAPAGKPGTEPHPGKTTAGPALVWPLYRRRFGRGGNTGVPPPP